jgi:hypothetical protein
VYPDARLLPPAQVFTDGQWKQFGALNRPAETRAGARYTF